ncbi:MAG: recombination regulator RecX [Firmicutes bacterium]|nr:recombination regulator RecX [Bacillota bacterium]
MLAARARTEQELRAALQRRGFSSSHVDEVVREMTRLGYLDDPKTAQRWAEYDAESGQWGVLGIARRLASRGLDPDLAAASARAACEGRDEFGVALAIARRKIAAEGPTSAGDDRALERVKRHVAGMLERRGFTTETIARVIREAFSGHGE